MVSNSREGRIFPVKIEEEMRASYLDYAMSVIVQRALPDVRDGLKPVQRRIMYAMSEMGLRPGSAYKKSANVVGEVMGKYHPHSDAPIYDAMARMAQHFSLRYPLVDGQGNYGSVDGDPPAAMRYTEARLAAIAEELLADIDKNTIDFKPNYDESREEPTVLPARLPNLLINGANGIAVGMATNIPPHNLSEICDAIARLIDNPEATTDELTEIVKGPDFPTSGIIIGREGIKNAFATGQGRIMVRARSHIEEMGRGGRFQIIITELPFQVNKAALIEKMADLVKDKRIDGISDLRDESDRTGMRIVIELKREGQPKQVLNTLYKHTALQSSFSVHMLCLVNNQPKTVNLATALKQHIIFRREVIRRRTEFDLEKAREREHIVSGLLRAIDQLDAIIQLIRASESASRAKDGLTGEPFSFSDRQAQAILELQLRRLAALERQQLQDEFDALVKQINYLEDLLASPHKVDLLIRGDVQDLKKRYGDVRRTQIIDQELGDFSDEDLIPHAPIVVTLSTRGYIKRIALDSYRLQRRGGKGIIGMVTRDADAVRKLLIADTHDSLLFFTERGRVFQLKAHEIPDATRQAKGIPLINLIDISQNEMVTAVVATANFEKDCLLLATKRGEVKRTPLEEFSAVRRNGLNAMNLELGDELISAKLARSSESVVLVSAEGQCIRFAVGDLRAASRISGGVRGIRLATTDALIGMEVVIPDGQLLTVSANGYGKRTPFEQYSQQARGGGGMTNFKVTDKTGPVVAVRAVNGTRELLIVSTEGVILRTSVESIRTTGRSAQGVHIMNIGPKDSVASIAGIETHDELPEEKPQRGKGKGREEPIA
ncbi:MAG: DNA gyrase subunit A [Dehalococcoidia bacterium]